MGYKYRFVGICAVSIAALLTGCATENVSRPVSVKNGITYDMIFIDVRRRINLPSSDDKQFSRASEALDINVDNLKSHKIYGGAGNDHIYAWEARNVQMFGGPGDDWLSGGKNIDLLVGGKGADTLEGGPGNDFLIIDQFDSYQGGLGQDRVIFVGNADLDVNISDHGVEIFNSGGGNDTLRTGKSHEAAFDGNDGNDHIFGGYGNDWLEGGRGQDHLEGDYGDDSYVFLAGDGTDTIHDFSYNHRVDTVYDLYSDGSKRNIRKRTVRVHEDAGHDRILFRGGITAKDIAFRADGQDIVIGVQRHPGDPFDEIKDKIRLVNWADACDRIESIEFSNGRKFDLATVFGKLGFVPDGSVMEIDDDAFAKMLKIEGSVMPNPPKCANDEKIESEEKVEDEMPSDKKKASSSS
jgi:hypothetical protein